MSVPAFTAKTFTDCSKPLATVNAGASATGAGLVRTCTTWLAQAPSRIRATASSCFTDACESPWVWCKRHARSAVQQISLGARLERNDRRERAIDDGVRILTAHQRLSRRRIAEPQIERA